MVQASNKREPTRQPSNMESFNRGSSKTVQHREPGDDQSLNKRVITVIGAGALGKWLAARLAQVGHEVTVITHREAQAQAIDLAGITVTDPNDHTWIQRVRALSSGALLSLHKETRGTTTPIENQATMSTSIERIILVCVKSMDLESVQPVLSHLLADATFASERNIIVSFQNGLGNMEKLSELVGRQSLVGAVITHGCTDGSSTKVSHRGVGTISVGTYQREDTRPRDFHGPSGEYRDDPSEVVVTAFNDAGLNASLTNDLQGDLWTKAAVNCAINPLTALLRVSNGVILQEPVRSIARDLIQEVVAVAAAEGVQLKHVWERLETVCNQTANNRSSMLQDVERDRPTEIEALNGAIIRIASRHTLPVPVNTTIANLIRSLSFLEKSQYMP